MPQETQTMLSDPKSQPSDEQEAALDEAIRCHAQEKLGGKSAVVEIVDRLRESLKTISLCDRRANYLLADPSPTNLQRVVKARILSERLRQNVYNSLPESQTQCREQLALEFAACLYPRKLLPNSTDAREKQERKLRDLARRLEAFLSHRGWQAAQMATYVTRRAASSQEAAEFVAAIPLTYLWTLDDDLLQRMLDNYRREREFVEYLRTKWHAPPPPGSPDPYGRPDLFERARQLRGTCDAKARRCGLRDRASRQDAVDAAWLHLWNALARYVYESPLVGWAKGQLMAFDFSPFRLRHEENTDSYSAPLVRHVLSREGLRVLREGYRFVRTTFFAPDDLVERVGAEAAHVRVRSAIDELYEYWLAPRTTVDEIAKRHGLTYATVNNWLERLKTRMITYVWARYPDDSALTNEDIADRVNRQPVRTDVAAFGKSMPASRTLAWALAGYVMLRDRDPWDFRRVADEVIEHWLSDELICAAIAADLLEQNEFAVRLRGAFRELADSISEQWEDLGLSSGREETATSALDSEADLLDRLGTPFVDRLKLLKACEPVAVKCVSCMLGTSNWRSKLRRVSEEGLNIAGRDGKCWVLPVLFLSLFERLSDTHIAVRLVPDQREKVILEKLGRHFRQAFNHEAVPPERGGDL